MKVNRAYKIEIIDFSKLTKNELKVKKTWDILGLFYVEPKFRVFWLGLSNERKSFIFDNLIKIL